MKTIEHERKTTLVPRRKPMYPKGFVTQPRMLTSAVSQFLDTWKWDYFVTFTTDYELSLKSCRRLMVNYAARLNLFNLSHGMPDDPTLLAWFCEANPNRGGHHIHALLKTPIGVQDQFQEWQKVSGSQWPKGQANRVRSEAYIRTLGASYYVSKYVTKEFCEWDIQAYNWNYFAGYKLDGTENWLPRAECKRLVYNEPVNEDLDERQYKLL